MIIIFKCRWRYTYRWSRDQVKQEVPKSMTSIHTRRRSKLEVKKLKINIFYRGYISLLQGINQTN